MSPRPNLDVCAESKRKMLIFQALYRNRKPQAFLGLPYNPFAPEIYAHTFTKQVMDMGNEVLLGESLWNKLGGEGTYNIILETIKEVKLEKDN